MAVDLSVLIDSLKRSINPPGVDTFDAADSVYLGYLSDAFWELRMLDMLSDYTESNGIIVSMTGGDDIGREMQQLILLFAAITIVTNELKLAETVFRAKAGPLEFETQKNGALLRDILAELQRRRVIAETALFDIGAVSDVYIDSVVGRSGGTYGGTWWVR